jgi:hypothetical protein
MNVLIWQIVVAVATMLMLILRWQLRCRHHREPERYVVPVRRGQRPPVPYADRVGAYPYYRQVMATRTVALTTLPIPIRGTIEPARYVRAETVPSPPQLSDLSFAPPDVALMRRVVEGLRALPANPRDSSR